MHTASHPLAGRTVTVRPAAPLPHHADTEPRPFRVEDWADLVFGRSWMAMDGNPVALMYAVRSAVGKLRLDDEVLYGKDEAGRGCLVHVSEIEEPDAGESRW